jgi:hypothetical protein
MALRDKLAARVQPMLEPGEQIQAVFLTQTGPSPYWFLATYFILFAIKRRIVVATDRAVVVVRAGAMTGTSAKEVLARLPRSTRIGPLSGLWARIELNGERQWVHKRFHGDVAVADSRAATGAPLPPPPQTVPAPAPHSRS